jgi:hypothetical protein
MVGSPDRNTKSSEDALIDEIESGKFSQKDLETYIRGLMKANEKGDLTFYGNMRLSEMIRQLREIKDSTGQNSWTVIDKETNEPYTYDLEEIEAKFKELYGQTVGEEEKGFFSRFRRS